MTLTVDRLVNIAMSNPINSELTARLPTLGLNQCWLTAGCLFQAVWNHGAGRPAAWGVNDYDVFQRCTWQPGRCSALSLSRTAWRSAPLPSLS